MSDTNNLIKQLVETSSEEHKAASPLGILLRWLFSSLVYMAVMTACSGLRPDLAAKLHEPLYMAEISALAAIIITSGLSAALLAYPDMHQKKPLVFAPIFAVLLFIYVLYLEYTAQNPNIPIPDHGADCLACITAFSLFSAIWMFAVLRKQATTHRYFAGAIILLGSSAVGAFTLRLCEEVDSIPHLLQWHYLPMIGFAALGIFLGKKLLVW